MTTSLTAEQFIKRPFVVGILTEMVVIVKRDAEIELFSRKIDVCFQASYKSTI